MAILSGTIQDFLEYFPRNRSAFPKRNTVSHTLEYLEIINSRYSGSNINQHDQFSEFNEYIATDIANRLINEGKTPRIAVVKGIINGGENREPIIPRLSEGKKEWEEYLVCCEGRWAYDPMIGNKPVVVKDYPEIAFLGKVDMSILIPEDNIRAYLGR